MNFKLSSAFRATAAALAVSAVAAPALADNLTYNVTGIQSVGELGNPANFVATLPLAAGAQVTGVSWNVSLSATSPSWLSEITVALSNSAQSVGYLLTPAPNADRSGTGSFSGSLALGANSFVVGNDGLLRLEFYDALDDAGITPDGNWLSGTLTFEVSAVPEPATYASLVLGLLAVGAAARRRAN